VATIASPIAWAIYLAFQGFGWISALFHIVIFVFGILFWKDYGFMLG
jgi:hypothetical protein